MKNTNSILLHTLNMTLICCLKYIIKLQDVMSICFVLNMIRYGGYNMKTNSLFMEFFLGDVNILTISYSLMIHDEQHLYVYILIYEDSGFVILGNRQVTSKKIFKAICLLWSFSVSKPVSNNFSYIAVYCLSILTVLTTNFGLGVLPLGLYMTPTRWGLPKPVLTGRNAQLAKNLIKLSYRQKNPKLHEWTEIKTEIKNVNYHKHCQYLRILILLSGDIELNPGPIRIITYNCRSLKESNKNIQKNNS